MKKIIVVTTLFATVMLNANSVKAEPSKEENIGFASGAISGGLVAGPIGFIVGAAIGAIIGDGANSKKQLEQTNTELMLMSKNESELKQQIAQLTTQNNNYLAEYENEKAVQAQLFSEGLTLNLMFTTGSAVLSEIDLNNIHQVSKLLNQYPELNLKLDGYTDPIGTKADNLLLSQDRINSVLSAFLQNGIESSRLLGNAHGEAEGYKIEDGSDAHAMARKVSLHFVKPFQSQVAQN